MKIDAIWKPGVQQQMFRVLLETMSRPGSVQQLPTDLYDSTAGKALLATLLDGEVTLSDRHGQLSASDWPLLQAESVESVLADYIFCDGGKAPDFEPRLGTLSCPDEAATIIIQVRSLLEGNIQLKLKGPGIQDCTMLEVAGLSSAWLESREDWVCAFPLGVDIFIVDDRHIVGLPRTTAVEVC